MFGVLDSFRTVGGFHVVGLGILICQYMCPQQLVQWIHGQLEVHLVHCDLLLLRLFWRLQFDQLVLHMV